MAQQAPLEPGSALYEFAHVVDLSKTPEKLRCKSCEKFLLNAFKTACCEDGICEPCTTAAAESACPICKHSPLVTNIGKGLRATARNYLKNQMANAEANKATEPLSTAPEPQDAPNTALEELKIPPTNGKPSVDDVALETPVFNAAQEENEQSEEVVQSIETQGESSRRATIVSTSGNDPDDDDIEIHVGLGEYDVSGIAEGSKRTPVDEAEQWLEEQPYEETRKNSLLPSNQNQSQNQSFNGNGSFNEFENSATNQNGNGVQNSDQQFWDMMQSGGMNNMNPMFAMMQNQPMMQQMMQQMQHMQSNGMMQNFPGMQYMQSMGMMPQMGMNGQNQNWPGNMMNMMNSNFNSMMNNGASFNNSQQQFQQNYQNGDYRFNRNGSFDRGRGRGRGRNKFRGGFNNQFSQQDQFGSFNNMPFPNQYNQSQMPGQQHQSDNNNYIQGGYQANGNKENIEQLADDDDFAPGGQDEVQEALGESYNNKQSDPPEETKVEEIPNGDTKQEEYQREPSPAIVEQTPVYESPKPEPKETYIPEAYREDLDFPSAPPTAPLGPASKDVPYRARGHGRFPSRGRGSYQGSVGFPPRSPARPVSQHQTNSPPNNQGSGVIGAPTGPRAMREKEAPTPKSMTRSESDVGFKIRGTATQSREQRAREEQPRNATPHSTHGEYDERDRDSTRRQAKYDRKYDNKYHEPSDDYDERDRKRRKSRREEDYDHDMQDAEYSRSDSPDKATSHRRKDKDRTRDKHSGSTSKYKSSRKHDDDYDDDRDDDNYGDDANSRAKSKKSGGKYDDRDDRRDRDYDRGEKDKHRKRSRHDRDHDDGDGDADEEESRRRSRKHKKEHRRDREPEASTDLGMRITGRSSTHRNSEMTTPNSNTPALSDKDPHTLEREARDRERMQKEQQRRQNAAANSKGLSGGRTRTF